MAHLRLVKSPVNDRLQVGIIFPLKADRTVIGRSPDSVAPGEDYIYLPHHAVQRRQAAVVRSGSGYVAQDLQSRSGIWVNGKHFGGADHPPMLADGDVIKICDFYFQFVEVDPHIVTS